MFCIISFFFKLNRNPPEFHLFSLSCFEKLAISIDSFIPFPIGLLRSICRAHYAIHISFCVRMYLSTLIIRHITSSYHCLWVYYSPLTTMSKYFPLTSPFQYLYFKSVLMSQIHEYVIIMTYVKLWIMNQTRPNNSVFWRFQTFETF